MTDVPPGNRCGGGDRSTRQDTQLYHIPGASQQTSGQDCRSFLLHWPDPRSWAWFSCWKVLCGCVFWGDRRCQVLELVRLPSSHGYLSPSRGLAALPTPTLTPTPVSCLHVASGIHPLLCPSTLLVALLEFLPVLFFFFLFQLLIICDLSSPTRDQTCTLGTGNVES